MGSAPRYPPGLPTTQLAPSPDALTPPSYVSPWSWPLRYCCGVSCPGSSAVPSSPWRNQWENRQGQWQDRGVCVCVHLPTSWHQGVPPDPAAREIPGLHLSFISFSFFN